MRILLAVLAVVVALVAMGCDSPTGTARPSPSLVDLEFTPQPSLGPSASPGEATAAPTQGSWPAGWDVAFCTGLTDTVVTHELVIDIQRALADDAREDAVLLTAELSQTLPIATGAVNRIRDWAPAAEVKTDLAALLELHAAVASAYQDYWDQGGRGRLRTARQARNQVARAVPAANEHLQELADVGLTCPGVSLELEAF